MPRSPKIGGRHIGDSVHFFFFNQAGLGTKSWSSRLQNPQTRSSNEGPPSAKFGRPRTKADRFAGGSTTNPYQTKPRTVLPGDRGWEPTGLRQTPARSPHPPESALDHVQSQGQRVSPGGCRSPPKTDTLGPRGRGEEVPAILCPKTLASLEPPPPPSIIVPCVTNGLGFARTRADGPPKGQANPRGARARRLQQLLCPIRRLPPKRVAPRPSLASCTCLPQNSEF